MSRVGKAPIPIPPGVEVKIGDQQVTVKGPKGTLERVVHNKINVEQVDQELIVTREDDERATRALHGLTRSLINNMVVGVADGYSKALEIVGVGYRAAPKGRAIELSLGFSHPVIYDPPEGIEIEVPNPTYLVVRGIDKEVVGQVAAEIRRFRPPEPYKGKGVRYEGERIIRKAGKAGAAAG